MLERDRSQVEMTQKVKAVHSFILNHKINKWIASAEFTLKCRRAEEKRKSPLKHPNNYSRQAPPRNAKISKLIVMVWIINVPKKPLC
jgi:hypothetical protein